LPERLANGEQPGRKVVVRQVQAVRQAVRQVQAVRQAVRQVQAVQEHKEGCVDKLKAEIFDLIRIQDDLKVKYAEVEKVKQEKLRKLKEMEDAEHAKV
jgi:hypothetical protein